MACSHWCGGSCDGESGPDYCESPGCPGLKKPIKDNAESEEVVVRYCSHCHGPIYGKSED